MKLPPEIEKKLTPLPYDLERYFIIDERTILIKISDLRPVRSRSQGILNANKLMLEAFNGKRRKREPVSVRKTKENYYLIVDGNSTYFNAVFSSWPCLAAKVCRDVTD